MERLRLRTSGDCSPLVGRSVGGGDALDSRIGEAEAEASLFSEALPEGGSIDVERDNAFSVTVEAWLRELVGRAGSTP